MACWKPKNWQMSLETWFQHDHRSSPTEIIWLVLWNMAGLFSPIVGMVIQSDEQAYWTQGGRYTTNQSSIVSTSDFYPSLVTIATLFWGVYQCTPQSRSQGRLTLQNTPPTLCLESEGSAKYQGGGIAYKRLVASSIAFDFQSWFRKRDLIQLNHAEAIVSWVCLKFNWLHFHPLLNHHYISLSPGSLPFWRWYHPYSSIIFSTAVVCFVPSA